VWPAMAKVFQEAKGDLAARMLATLDAAEAQGGDIRGKQAVRLWLLGDSMSLEGKSCRCRGRKDCHLCGGKGVVSRDDNSRGTRQRKIRRYLPHALFIEQPPSSPIQQLRNNPRPAIPSAVAVLRAAEWSRTNKVRRAVPSVTCPRCGAQVATRRLPEHFDRCPK
jgi:hypothetical protein